MQNIFCHRSRAQSRLQAGWMVLEVASFHFYFPSSMILSSTPVALHILQLRKTIPQPFFLCKQTLHIHNECTRSLHKKGPKIRAGINTLYRSKWKVRNIGGEKVFNFFHILDMIFLLFFFIFFFILFYFFAVFLLVVAGLFVCFTVQTHGFNSISILNTHFKNSIIIPSTLAEQKVCIKTLLFHGNCFKGSHWKLQYSVWPNSMLTPWIMPGTVPTYHEGLQVSGKIS